MMGYLNDEVAQSAFDLAASFAKDIEREVEELPVPKEQIGDYIQAVFEEFTDVIDNLAGKLILKGSK